MIQGFAHKGLRDYFRMGSKSGIRPEHAARLKLLLARLNTASAIQDLGFPGSDLHPLKGRLEGHWAVKVSRNWRITFRFEDGHALDIDYQDYH